MFFVVIFAQRGLPLRTSASGIKNPLKTALSSPYRSLRRVVAVALFILFYVQIAVKQVTFIPD
jgi:hypothetical protein